MKSLIMFFYRKFNRQKATTFVIEMKGVSRVTSVQDEAYHRDRRKKLWANLGLIPEAIEIIEDFKSGKISEVECQRGIKLLYSPGGLRDYRISKLLK